LERNRRRRLLVKARDPEGARRALAAAGWSAEMLPDGSLALAVAAAVAAPDDIAGLLVGAGTPPTLLMVEEEELEQYFLRLVGSRGGAA
jgi:ABC-2 type transport system ATP-binding protein